MQTQPKYVYDIVTEVINNLIAKNQAECSDQSSCEQTDNNAISTTDNQEVQQ